MLTIPREPVSDAARFEEALVELVENVSDAELEVLLAEARERSDNR